MHSQRGELLWGILERCWSLKPEDRATAETVKVLIAEMLSA